MNRSEELIACLEGEIVNRDARIAELESVVGQRNGELTSTNRVMCSMALDIVAVGEALDIPVEYQDGGTAEFVDSINQLRAELAALREQVPVAWMLKNEKGRIEEILPYMPCASDMQPYWPEPTLLYAAPVAKQVVMPDVTAAAKALCKHHAELCNVNADDQWNVYSQDFIADAEIVLANSRLNAADQEGCQDE
jgi:hypothetical protein